MSERFELEDWDDEERHDGHVMAYYGVDITAFDPLFQPTLASCPFCAGSSIDRDALILDEFIQESISNDKFLLRGKKMIHLVACGSCGARGPWAEKESLAISFWNEKCK